jgi:hypothetical protein
MRRKRQARRVEQESPEGELSRGPGAMSGAHGCLWATDMHDLRRRDDLQWPACPSPLVILAAPGMAPGGTSKERQQMQQKIVQSLKRIGVALLLGAIAGRYLRNFLLHVMISHRNSWGQVPAWLFDSGHDHLGMLCNSAVVELPIWLPAIALGMGIGWTAPREWLWLGCLCGLSLVITPNVTEFLHGMHPLQIYDLDFAIETMLWDATAIPILLASGWGSSRWRHLDRRPPDALVRLGSSVHR